VQLQSVSIKGFRSIRDLPSLALGSPTVLAGHNDAGKSAIIHAILFLLDSYSLTESDRTYVSKSDGTVSPALNGVIERVPETYVAGTFGLNEEEASEYGTSPLQVRRIARAGAKPILEVLRSVPEDARLRDLDPLSVAQLEDRLKTLGLELTKGKKADYLERLKAAADAAPQTLEWVGADAALGKALPAGRRFDAASAVDADVAIKDTLITAYRSHLDSEDLHGSVRTIEEDLETRLVKDADEIRQYIMEKVRDIGDVQIKPSVSFTSANGLKSTDITVTNQAGENINLQLS
jgi:putative ATP-dependent endonuclease of OLD family